jgi:pyruvate-formate lyase-activating enzyme
MADLCASRDDRLHFNSRLDCQYCQNLCTKYLSTAKFKNYTKNFTRFEVVLIQFLFAYCSQ